VLGAADVVGDHQAHEAAAGQRRPGIRAFIDTRPADLRDSPVEKDYRADSQHD
jgi:hypothetical protein